jgi:hypothetical protein
MSTYEERKAGWERRPTWELQNMARALGMMAWLNTPEETERKAIAEEILRDRARAERKARKARKAERLARTAR